MFYIVFAFQIPIMKHISTLALAILMTNLVFAQKVINNPKLHAHKLLIHNLLNQHNAHKENAQKTTSGPITQRVIALRTKDNTLGTMTDSVNFKYIAYGQSNYDYNDMIYAYNYPYNSSPMFNFAGAYTKPQVQFDTMRHWEVNPNTLVYGYYETGMAGYDTRYNMTGFLNLYADSAVYPNMLFSNNFNTANNITKGTWYNWHGGVADSAFKQYFSYNTSNLLTKDSTYEYHSGAWYLVSKSFYTYDGLNNLIQIDNYANDSDSTFLLPLVEKYKYVNTYDGSYRLLTVLTSVYNGTSLSDYVKDTFDYTGSYTFHTGWRETQWDVINGYWAPMFNMTKHLNLSGQPDTVNIMGFDSLLNTWVPQTMDIVSYNSMSNPDTLKDYEYNFTSFPATPSFTTIYYYDIFRMSLGVTTNCTSAADVWRVYPNPAHNQINVDNDVAMRNNTLTISLTNVLGQKVLSAKTNGETMTSILTQDLLPGIYLLTINNLQGQMVHHENVVIR